MNRPQLTTGRVVVNLDPPVTTDRELEIWVGGPVEPQRSWMLVGGERDGADPDQVADASKIADELYLSTSPDLLRRMLEPRPAAAHQAGGRLCRMGSGAARSRARGVVVADQRRRSRPDLRHAARSDVGGRASGARRRSVSAADESAECTRGVPIIAVLIR